MRRGLNRCPEFQEERRRAFEDPNHTTACFISAVEVCVRGHDRFYIGRDLSKPATCAECGREKSQKLTKIRRKENPNQKKQRTPAEKLEYRKLILKCEAGPIKTLQEAISDGDIMYFSNTPCKYGHISAKRIPGSRCLTCHLDPPSAELREIVNQQILAGSEEKHAKKIEVKRLYDIEYRDNMPEEKKKEQKTKNQARNAAMTEEERAAKNDKNSTTRRKRKEDPEYLKQFCAKSKEYSDKISPEQKEQGRKLARVRYKKNGNKKNKEKRQRDKANLGPTHIRKRRKLWRTKNKPKILSQAQQKRNTPTGRLKDSCNAVARTLAKYWGGERIPRSKRINLLYYTPREHYIQLEKTLPKGVSMEQASVEHWHIDHYVPLGLIGKFRTKS